MQEGLPWVFGFCNELETSIEYWFIVSIPVVKMCFLAVFLAPLGRQT